MDDLRRRFASLDEVPAPQLWGEIERRAAAAGSVARVTGVVTPGMRSGRPARPSFALLLATAAVLVALVAGAIAVGSGLIRLPAILPDSLSSIGPTRTAVPEPQLNVVAYRQAGRIWVVDADGTDARQLVPPALDPEKPRYLDAPDVQDPLAWSPDGSRLYFVFGRVESRGPQDGIGQDHAGVAVTDAAGSAPVDLVDLTEPQGGSAWCPAPSDNCGRGRDDSLSMSPDATRLAYTIAEGNDQHISTIVVLDIASGQITRLESTQTLNPRTLPEGEVGSGNGQEACTAAHGGYNGVPQWSPDGTRLVFTRTECRRAIFTVNADGSDLRELAPFEFGPEVVPRWSPDGSRILFNSSTDWFVDGPQAGRVDISTIRPDGTDLQALTTDGLSVWPYWTGDGRIVFVRWTVPDGGAGDLWVMDGDGGNPTQIAGTVPGLTAVGCTVCPFPVAPKRYATEGRVNERFWQPTAVSR